MPSPGRPSVAWREDRVRFWQAIARGLSSVDSAAAIGVSPAVLRYQFALRDDLIERLVIEP